MKQGVRLFDASFGHGNNSLLVALVITTTLHVIAILGINISQPKTAKINRILDITITNKPVKKAPEKAIVLAQDNQAGAGENIRKPLPAVQKSAAPLPVTEQKQIIKPLPSSLPVKSAAKKVTQAKAEVKTRVAQEPKKNKKDEAGAPKTPLSAASLQQQVAQLGAEILHAPQQSSDDTKIKFVNSISAHKYIAAQYTRDWELKVERTGNMNYPEVAVQKSFSATLTMDVGIKADGTIYSMRINKSSGNLALDEAAKRIVRMSAPFPPLPTELLKELNVLVITRVWKFSDESGLVAQ
jgi:protein TonB